MYWHPPPHQPLLGLDYRGSTLYISFLFIIDIYCPRLTKYKKEQLHSKQERMLSNMSKLNELFLYPQVSICCQFSPT